MARLGHHDRRWTGDGSLQTVTVCPLTTQLHPTWRSRLQVRCNGRRADIAVDQLRTVSKTRLGSRVGALSEDEAAALRLLITEMYGVGG